MVLALTSVGGGFDLERAIGRLEGRFDSLDVRITELIASFERTVSAYEHNNQVAITALRNDVVHANTDLRERLEEETKRSVNSALSLESRVLKLERRNERAEGADGMKARLLRFATTALPYIISGGGIGAWIMAAVNH